MRMFLLKQFQTLLRKNKLFTKTVHSQKIRKTEKAKITQKITKNETFTTDKNPNNQLTVNKGIIKMDTTTKIQIECKFEFEQNTNLDIQEKSEAQQPEDQSGSSEPWAEYQNIHCLFWTWLIVKLISHLIEWFFR